MKKLTALLVAGAMAVVPLGIAIKSAQAASSDTAASDVAAKKKKKMKDSKSPQEKENVGSQGAKDGTKEKKK